MSNNRRDKSGISSVLGSLLIVLVTATAGVGAYVFANTLQGNMEVSSGAGQTREQLTIENAKLTFNATGNVLTLHVRNTGPIKVDFDKLYVDGAIQGTSNFQQSPTGPIAVQGVVTLTKVIQNDAGALITTEYSQGTNHAIKIATKSGAIFPSNVIKGPI